MTTATGRETTLRNLTDLVGFFDPNSKVQRAHFLALTKRFGEMWAAMLVSQDVAANGEHRLELTDPGAVNSWSGWREVNRVVRHGEEARYTVFDFAADTKVGGRLIKMFTRDQTIPGYLQPE